jgi:hypothetical protein
MTLTRPDGTVVALPDNNGATATWAPGTAAPGLYVISGTIAADGRSATVLSHFTIFAPPQTTAPITGAPAVQKNAGPVADSVASSDGAVAAAWTGATFGEPVVVQILPKSAAAASLPDSATVVQVTAFLRDSHLPVTQIGDVIDVQFRNAPLGATPQTSQDAQSWSTVDELPTFQLPDGQATGWFRDSDGTIHVLSRKLMWAALLTPDAATKLVMNIVTPRRLWLEGRRFMAVRIFVTARARVTGSFVDARGRVIPGQVIKTPTRRAGATILRVPLHVAKPGLYRLQVHAEGLGQTVNKTARIRFVRTQPKSPIWQDPGPLRVAVIKGAPVVKNVLGAGDANYAVQSVADAELYSVVNPVDRHAAAAVIVDLSTVPLSSLASLHALLPELRIIGVTSDRTLAAAARKIGVQVRQIARHATATKVTREIKSLIPRR